MPLEVLIYDSRARKKNSMLVSWLELGSERLASLNEPERAYFCDSLM
jgi:hypothetical protein